MAMVDLIESPEEQKKDYGGVMAAPMSDPKPRYPYCLQISFDDDVMEKLGITEMPAVGDTLNFTAESVVTGTNASATGEEECKRISLQITHIDIGGGEKPSMTDRMYNGREDEE